MTARFLFASRARLGALPGLALLALVAPGCDRNELPPTATVATTPPATEALPWLHDDYRAALAAARAKNAPLVVDIWAPWCHTCLAMHQSVLRAPEIVALADRFVWLAVDSDRAANAAFLAKAPPKAWPTFLVLSPDETVQARVLGSASVEQFRAFLLAGERGTRAGAAPSGDPDLLLRDAEHAVLRGELDLADTAYQRAVAASPADWPRRPDVLVSLVGLRVEQHAWPACANLARAEMGNTGNSASAADFASYALECADNLADDAAARPLAEAVVARLTPLVADLAAPLSVDDRSDALRILREAHRKLGQDEAARSVAERQRALLDEAAAAALSPAAAMTFNWPRAEVYVFLGRGAELVPALSASAAALPGEYDPPYRLAWLQLELGRHAEALANAERALALSYGPRRARVQALVADIHAARGDRAAERAARQEVVRLYESLPEGQRQPGAEKLARERLAALAP